MSDFEERLTVGLLEYVDCLPMGRYRVELIDTAEDAETGEDVAVVMMFRWRRRRWPFKSHWVEMGAVTVPLPEEEGV